jgi:hypothetical protein
MKPIPIFLASALAYGQISGSLNAPQTRAANGAVVSQPPATFDCSAGGTVVNAVTGEPVARAHVSVISAGTAYAASTDGSGNWLISNMGCAPAQLQVTRPGFLQGAGGNAGRDTAAFRSLQLVSGSPARDLRTELFPQSVALGRVLDDQGDPVMGVQIVALATRVVEGRARLQQAGAAVTNDLGEYRLANLQRGKYLFCAHMNQNAAIQSASQTIPADSCYPGPLEGGPASAMEISAGRETKIDFTVNQVLPVHIRGTITGLPEGRGIGVNLIKRSVSSDFQQNVPGTVRGGQFDFRVPSGSYMITADYFEAGKRLSARVPVDAGASDIDNVVVHLDSGFTITGTIRVISQSGRPAPQFGMSLRPSEPANATGQFKRDPDHPSFTFTDMVPGDFRLETTAPAPFYVKSANLAGQDILNNEIPISQAAGPIEVTLADDGGSIDADVVDSAGNPVAARVASVMLLRGRIRVSVFTAQSNGHIRLQNVAPGDYTIYAWDDPNAVQYAEPDWMRRYGAGGVPVSVTAGQNVQVKVTEQRVPVE